MVALAGTGARCLPDGLGSAFTATASLMSGTWGTSKVCGGMIASLRVPFLFAAGGKPCERAAAQRNFHAGLGKFDLFHGSEAMVRLSRSFMW